MKEKVCDFSHLDVVMHDFVTALSFETSLYNMSDEFIKDYSGGVWKLVFLEKGVFYALMPEMSSYVTTNLAGREIRLNRKEASIYITILALEYMRKYDLVDMLKSYAYSLNSKNLAAILD